MTAICAEHPGSTFEVDGHLEYGIRAETPQYAYLFAAITRENIQLLLLVL